MKLIFFSEMALWSEDECRDFESGMLFNFNLFQSSISETVLTCNLVLIHSFLIFLFPFLSGLRVYGKDFRQIQKNKVSLRE